MAYGRLEFETYQQVMRYGKRNDSKIRDFFGVKTNERIGFNRILEYWLKTSGEWELEPVGEESN